MRIKKRWKTLIFVYLLLFSFGLVMQVIPPVSGLLIPALDLTRSQVGLLMSLFALPGIFLSIPGGIIADSFGPKRVAIIAFIIIITGSLVAGSSPNYPLLALGRFVTGVGATVIPIVASQALSQSFMNHKLGMAMGIANTAVPAGTIFALNLFNRMGDIWTWRAPFFFTAGLCLLLLLLLLWFIDKDSVPKGESGLKNIFKLSSMRGNTLTWLLAVAWMSFVASKASATTFAPDFFMSTGFSIGYAGFLTSLFTMGSFLISPGIGYLIDKTSRHEYYLAAGGLLLAVSFFYLPFISSGHIFLSIVIGIGSSLVPVAVFSLVPALLPSAQLGLGYGILRLCESIGILLGPYFAGIAFDFTGTYHYSFTLIAGYACCAAAGSLLLHLMHSSFLRKSK